MSIPKLFCYASQAHRVMDFMRGMEITPIVMHAINSPQPLRGVDRISFFQIKGHPSTIPPDIREALMQTGAVVIEIDDTFARQLAMARHSKERP
jgi:hypothetical protein